MNRTLSILGLALAALTIVPADADARRKSSDEPIAVWELLANDMDRGEAGPIYREIAASLDNVPGVRGDTELRFMPDVRPSEGVVVAQTTAARWLDAAWIAYQRREWSVARALLDDAIALVEPYPHERLPEGIRYQLYLLKARTDIRGGNDFDGREALRAAMALDPSWEASPRWEPEAVVDLYQEVREETIGVPPARISILTSVPGATIMVGGIERGHAKGTQPIELLLPPGSHEITAMRPGYSSHTQTLFLTPRQTLDLEFYLEVKNTARFQEQITRALEEPQGQRRSGVWGALDLALESVASRGVLTGRYDGDTQVLQVGLFFPRRQGWAFYRAIPLGGSDEQSRVDAAIEDLLLTVDRTMHPVAEEVATR
ncbi:MAG: PEGA domain-containing protein [Deltaproteobacteria bacterium]|nr:PEGA domain-containing protein [Deltaproteobacteria bacterium]